MKNFMKDPLKVFLSIIGISFVMFLTAISFTSCESKSKTHFEQAQETKQAIEVVNHNDKAIIIETLHKGTLGNGVYKLTIDSTEYIVLSDFDALAITKHK